MIPGVAVLAILATIAAVLVVRYLLATTMRLVLALAIVAGLGAAVYKFDAPTASWLDHQCHDGKRVAGRILAFLSTSA